MFKKILSGGIISAAESVVNVIDKFVETDEEKKAAALLKSKIEMQPHLAQIELNKLEAGHRSVFVAGWRPAIGWVCALGLIWHFFLYDLLNWIIINTVSPDIIIPKLMGVDSLISLVVALLGLGGMRSLEKLSGKAR